MRRFYANASMIAAVCMASMTATAQTLEAPKGDKLQDGKTYTFFNLCTPDRYNGRTSWDGAIYSEGNFENSFVQLTAQANANGSWSFYYEEEPIEGEDVGERYYMNLPAGSGNVNIKGYDSPEWIITDGTVSGYYYVQPSTGNNPSALIRPWNMHLNKGGGYVVVSYDGDGWYPDFYGDIKKDEYGDPVMLPIIGPDGEEYDIYLMADSSSCNWAFVEVDNVLDFVTKSKGYSVLKSYSDKYLADESYAEYATGFKATYDAALAIYNGAEFFDEDVETINAMISTKVALYNLIEEAMATEDADDVLLAAIDNAKKSFDNSTLVTELETANATLKDALDSFILGTGDLTSLGQNMSFEDLSSQNGAQTSGVGGAPTGWNVYINGKQVVTADDVRAAGIGNWHGINNDSNGEGKDGNYAFGLWAPSVPQYEISQTVEGLENGTYTVSAGLMVGANGSGSRRTTQRIFGNLNSTYFGFEEEYDTELIAQDEVYGFQNNEEPVTDTELLPIEVKAYVYDGTLTFGFRTDGNIAAALRYNSNSAGGDGWFKIDNFRIRKEGFDIQHALDINSFFQNNLNNLLTNTDNKMYPTLRTEATAARDASKAIGPESSKEDIDAAIVTVSTVISDAFKSAAKYAELSDAIVNAYESLEMYEHKLGAGVFADAIMDVEDNWDFQRYESAEEIDEAIKYLSDALQACIESDVIEEGSDLTEYIRNNSFEDLRNQNNTPSGGVVNAPYGWTLVLNGEEVTTAAEISASGVSAWCAINEGDNINVEFEDNVYTHQYTDGTHLWGIFSANMPEVEIYQTLNVPAGVYELTADVMVEHNWSGNNITTQRLFGNSSVQMWARDFDYDLNFTQDMLDAQVLEEYNISDKVTYFSYAGYDNDVSGGYTSLLRPMSVKFVVGEDGVAKIGFRTNNMDLNGVASPRQGTGWFKLDNFHLTCVSLGVVEAPELPAAIDGVTAANKDAAIYDLTGRQVTSPVKGVYIQGGKKVFVK